MDEMGSGQVDQRPSRLALISETCFDCVELRLDTKMSNTTTQNVELSLVEKHENSKVKDNADSEEESSEEESVEDVTPAVRNRFDLLLGSADESEEEVSESKAEEAQAESPLEDTVVRATDKRPQKKRNRKKKRKNAAKAQALSKENDSDWYALLDDSADKGKTRDDAEFLKIPDEYFRKTDDENFRSEANEIFKSIREIVAEQCAEDAERNRPKSNADANVTLASSLNAITVEPRLLSADAELKKLFGFKVVEAERRNEEQEAASRVQRRGRGQRRVPPRSRIRRKFSLVNPRDSWYSEVPGLSMVIDTDAPVSESGIRYFRYRHEGYYETLQRDYRTVVATHDVNNLAGFALRRPHHVDSLIQLAEVQRQMGELDRAAEHIERSLHILESAWNLSFKPFQGDCRLRFEVPENKAIYIALFRYAQLLTRRGLHRTALEISKLVLNFDPENDPMGILMIIDSLALLSEEYEWICTMQRDFKLLPLQYFPNFAFNGALAVFSLQNGAENMVHRANNLKKKKKKGKASGGGEEGNESQSIFADQSISPHDLLTNALLAFPMALRPLLAATKDSGGSWSSHRLFSSAHNDRFRRCLIPNVQSIRRTQPSAMELGGLKSASTQGCDCSYQNS